MATTQWITPCYYQTDADFRAWGLAMSDAMTAVDLTKTADSGQIDWATVSKASASSVAGYEIRYLDDSLHGTCPIYVKIEWGTGSSTSRPLMFLTAGTGSDGSGNITGTAILVRTQIGNNTAAGVINDFPGAACGVEGAAWVAWGSAGGAATAFLLGIGIHRTCDPDGTPNANGAYLWWVGSSSQYIGGRHYHRVGANAVTAYGVKGLGDGARDSLNRGNIVYTLPAMIFTDKPEPVVGLRGIYAYDFEYGTTFVQVVQGQARTFFPLSHSKGYPNNNMRNADGENPNITHACIWE